MGTGYPEWGGSAALAEGDLDRAEIELCAEVASTEGIERAVAMANLGYVVSCKQRHGEAKALWEAALSLVPDVAEHLTLRAHLHAGFAGALISAGEEANAEVLLVQALAVLERAPVSQRTVQALATRVTLASLQANRGQAHEAMATLADVTTRLSALGSPAHPTALLARVTQAQIDYALGDEQAVSRAKSILAEIETAHGPDHFRSRQLSVALQSILDGVAFRESDDPARRIVKIVQRAQNSIARGEFMRAICIARAMVRQFEQHQMDEEMLAIPRELLRDAHQGRFDSVYERMGVAYRHSATFESLSPTMSELDEVATDAELDGVFLFAALARVHLSKANRVLGRVDEATHQMQLASDIAARSGDARLIAAVGARASDH